MIFQERVPGRDTSGNVKVETVGNQTFAQILHLQRAEGLSTSHDEGRFLCAEF